MEHEGHPSKKKVEPKITRVSIGLMGKGPDEGKSPPGYRQKEPGRDLDHQVQEKT